MNKKLIILGFPDAAGNGAPVEKLFSEADFDRAKISHKFPAGVQRLKMFRADEIDSAEFMGAGVGEAIEAAEQKAAEQSTAAAAAAKAVSDGNAKIAAAAQKLQDTARARNEVMGKLHQAETKLRNHNDTPETLRGKLHDGTVKELQKLIFGDPEKKVAGLQDQVKSAIADFDKVQAEYNELVKPLNEKLAAPPKPQIVEA